LNWRSYPLTLFSHGEIMHVLETENVEYRYPNGAHALCGIDLKIKRSGKIAILGPNGAGKSTLLYLFNATLRPTSGTVLLNGTPMHYDASSLREIRRTVGMLFPNPDDQLFAPTVKQDVSFGPLNLKLTREDVEERVSKSLDLVGMTGFETIPPHNLSSGQKKRVAIAGVLAMDPPILVFDEPLSGLDPEGQTNMIELLDQLNADGKTIIVTTHRMDFAAEWADEIWVLKNGQLLKKGTPDAIFSNMSVVYEAGLQVPVPIKAHNELRLRGFDHERVPLSVLELVESVASFSGGNRHKNQYALAKCDFSPLDDCFIGTEKGLLMASGEYFENCFTRCRCLDHAQEGEKVRIDISDVPNGSIWIIRISGAEEAGTGMMPATVVQNLIDLKKPHRIGAMGTVAKSIITDAGLKYDFGTEVVNSALSTSLRGLSTMIFATGKMAELAARRVAYLNQRMDKDIESQMIVERCME